MINEYARAGRLPAQHGLLARVDQCQVATAQCSRGGVKIDIMRHRVGFGVDEGYLDIVALMHHHERRRDRSIERHRLKFGPHVVDDHFLFHDDNTELHNFRTIGGRLVVGMYERWCDEINFSALQIEFLRDGRLLKTGRREYGR